jgi:hypothetical protein
VFKYSSRFWLYAPTTLFLTVAAAVMIYWWMAAGAFEKKLAALKGHDVIPGVTLDWTTVQISGFPFRVDADFGNFRVQGAGAYGPFSWTTEKFALHALTYGRVQTVYEAAGRQQVSWTAADGSTHAASFLPGSMRGSSIVDARGLRRFDLDIADLGDKAFTIARFQFHMRRNGKDLDLMVKADAVKTPETKPENLQAYTSLSRADALAPLLRAEMSWPQAVANWRAQGGQAKLSQVIAVRTSPELFLTPLY